MLKIKKNNLFQSFIFGWMMFLVFGCAANASDSTNADLAANDSILNNSVKTAGSLSVSTLTSPAGGKYAPNHVLAIWVETSKGTFVKSLLVYAQKRKDYLTNWLASSSENTTDAVTGATLNSHVIRTCTWDGTDASGKVVGDGAYRVCMELTDKNATGNFSTFGFTKGAAADKQSPTNVTSFSSLAIQWTPKN